MAGRGGFGGGGRGGAAGGRLSTAPMGMTTFQDVQAASKSQQARYPETEGSAHTESTTSVEERSSLHLQKLLDWNRTSAFWPIIGDKKKAELTTFSTQYNTEEQERPSLKSLSLQKEVFPMEIWNSFMEGETRRERMKARDAANRKKKATINWDTFDDKEKEGVDPDDTQADLEEEEAELGDYEDEEDDDYAENYFDNGEDDGGMDGGGSDGGGEAAYD